jgi:acetyl-CoA carboxylase carboxyl transferase subunit alpha
MPDLLDFEEPIGVLLKEIEALRLMPQTTERQASIAQLEARADELRADIYARLTPWQCVQVARHPNRPCMLDYVERLIPDFTELHGDRRFADDKAIVTGLGHFHDRAVVVIGHQKGRDTKQKIYRNFGYAKPEGYRKALRVLKMAERFNLPVVVFVDTPAAYPGMESEERGVAEAIALNLREMALLNVPIVVLVIGEGGSGGALGIAVGDRILMQEFTIYSVIPPEGCAAILWRDAKRKVEAAEALKITSRDLLALELIDEVVKEPVGGAQNDYDLAAARVGDVLDRHLSELSAMASEARLEARYAKFRAMGRAGQAFTDPGSAGSTGSTGSTGSAGSTGFASGVGDVTETG